MIRFLVKGLMRDPNRSVFPVLIVGAGVMITVLFYCWVLGIREDITRNSAILDTGHVKITTRAYAEIPGQMPNDLALPAIGKRLSQLSRDCPELDWVARIKFGGLLDFPDGNGETRVQGPVFGMALDLLSPQSTEVRRMNLANAVVRGRLPEKPGEILISEEFAEKLRVNVGETATLISATATGSMAVQNFTLAGTVRFGIGVMDKGTLIADIRDIQYALDMVDSASEILGYFHDMNFDQVMAFREKTRFNAVYQNVRDEFSPVMETLKDQNGLGEYLDWVDWWIFIFIFVFILIMSIVLWNTGLMSGIRRYGEIGVRLAIGESKGHVYRMLIGEALAAGIAGSCIGTFLGLGISYYLQEVGIDISGMLQSAAILLPNILKAKIGAGAFYMGFIPGLGATVLGALISGINIFRRETAQLFKELET
jgi:putative ABC transport system permease protein